jgi:hypothetical protein
MTNLLAAVSADGVYQTRVLHSAAEDISVLSADVVETDNLLCQLDVVTKVAWGAEVGENIDDVLLLTQEIFGKSLSALLALLLGSKLDNLDALLTSLLGRSLALARRRLARSLSLHRRRGLSSGPIVLVYSLHVVEEVVATGEAVTWHRSLAIAEVAQVRPRAVTVHAVSFTLVAEKACSRRELHTDTGLLVAAERLQVRVDVLAVGKSDNVKGGMRKGLKCR